MPKQIVYWSEDDGSLYMPRDIDGADATGSNDVEGYHRYVIDDTVTLSAGQIAIGYSDIIQVLLAAKKAKKV